MQLYLHSVFFTFYIYVSEGPFNVTMLVSAVIGLDIVLSIDGLYNTVCTLSLYVLWK